MYSYLRILFAGLIVSLLYGCAAIPNGYKLIKTNQWKIVTFEKYGITFEVPNVKRFEPWHSGGKDNTIRMGLIKIYPNWIYEPISGAELIMTIENRAQDLDHISPELYEMHGEKGKIYKYFRQNTLVYDCVLDINQNYCLDLMMAVGPSYFKVDRNVFGKTDAIYSRILRSVKYQECPLIIGQNSESLHYINIIQGDIPEGKEELLKAFFGKLDYIKEIRSSKKMSK
jgi:hypothetical protein